MEKDVEIDIKLLIKYIRLFLFQKQLIKISQKDNTVRRAELFRQRVTTIPKGSSFAVKARIAKRHTVVLKTTRRYSLLYQVTDS